MLGTRTAWCTYEYQTEFLFPRFAYSNTRNAELASGKSYYCC